MPKTLAGFALLAASLAFAEAPRPEPPLKAPSVKFVAATERDGYAYLTFEVTNPNAVPLPYVGYVSESFDGGLKKGVIAPIYKIEVNDGQVWKAHPIGFCGTGIGDVSIPAKAKVKFQLLAPPGDWRQIKVGLTWYNSPDRKGKSAAALSDPVSRKDAGLKE